ncbi:MAG TPA: DegV family protein [Dehalococcoidia bacterium]|nr:DegV family protein [Dehalococcoidia bacterium]
MVNLVTDSVSDLPPEVAKDMGITVIPLNVHFGTETYEDGIELTSDEFYHKLEGSSTLPTTSAPSAGLFAEVFDRLAEKTNEVLAVFLSRKLSATYDTALQGMKLMKKKCQVEVVDSTLGIMGQGLLVIEAAKRALAGASLNEIVSAVAETIPRIHIRVTLDTLKYLAMGGRIGKAQALIGSMLKINPILGIKDGEAFPFARVRSRTKATEWLYEFAANFSKVKALAVEYGTNAAEAKALAKRIASVFPNVPLYVSNVSPVIGTHTGPSVLSVTVLEG